MPALTFLIELLEPLLVSQAQSGEPNSAISLPFIPGSTVRGAVIARYGDLDAADKTAQDLFFNGAVCYLNAYPAHAGDNPRMLPKPVAWLVEKDNADRHDAEIYNFAVKSQTWDQPAKPPSGEFYWQGTDSVQLGAPEMCVAVHNASDDPSRKNEKTSQVFRYDALAAGQVFAGVIVTEDKSLLGKIQPFLEQGTLTLGRSHTAGYGAVRITDVRLVPDWREYAPEQPAEAFKDRVTLTCLSDVILRRDNGQVDGRIGDLVGVSPRESFCRMRLVGGFNRQWGLPLPQAWAIQAGSVFVFDANKRDVLEKLAATGIGERRAEGFGRIAVNLHAQADYQRSRLEKREIPAKPLTLSTESRNLVQRMVDRRLQSELERALVREINTLTNNGKAFRGLPSPAQLARARLAARQAWHSDDLAKIKNHFERLSKLSQREWVTARVRGESLKDWILDVIAKKDSFDPVAEKPTLGEVTANFAGLRDKTLTRLIEGVLKQAIQAAKKQQEGGGR